MATRRALDGSQDTAPRAVARALGARARWAARSRPTSSARSSGSTLLVLGAMTLIALMLPGRGRPDQLVDRGLRAVVRDDALAAAVLPAGRRLVARMGPGDAAGIGLGDHAPRAEHHLRRDRGRGPGPRSACPASVASGDALAGTLTDWFTAPGAFILLVGLAVLGIIVGFGIPLRRLMHPAVGTARWFGRDRRRLDATDRDRRRRRLEPPPPASRGHRRQRRPRRATQRQDRPRRRPSPGQTGVWGESEELAIPAAVPSKGQTSSTFAPARGHGRRRRRRWSPRSGRCATPTTSPMPATRR